MSKEIKDKIKELESQLEDGEKEEPEEKEVKEKDDVKEEKEEIEIDENDEQEENKQIEPQTNGTITDEVKSGVKSDFEQKPDGVETTGIEQVLSANLDQRFASMNTAIAQTMAEVDKINVVLAQLLTRIEVVQEVTDKVVDVDHDSLLSESIQLLI